MLTSKVTIKGYHANVDRIELWFLYCIIVYHNEVWVPYCGVVCDCSLCNELTFCLCTGHRWNGAELANLDLEARTCLYGDALASILW